VHRVESARRHHQPRLALPSAKQRPVDRQGLTLIKGLERVDIDTPSPLSLDGEEGLLTHLKADDTSAASSWARSATESETETTLAKAHSSRWILVLDADAHARGRLAGALRDAAYEVQEAADGAAALELMSVSLPDLVFADAGAPTVNGSAFFDLWSSTGRQAVPLVVTSASVEDQDLADRLGATGCLRKPYDAGEVLATAALLCAVPSEARQATRRHFESLASVLATSLRRMVGRLPRLRVRTTRTTVAS
jgi:CheY-like chemotaxis protein